MKKLQFIFIPVIVFAIAIPVYMSVIRLGRELPEVMLLESFSRTGARVVSAEIYFWSSLESQKFQNLEQLKELAADFSRELGLKKDSGFSSRLVSNDVLQEIEMSGQLNNEISAASQMVNLRFQLPGSQNGSEGQNGPEEGFIGVDMVQESSGEGLPEIRKQVEAVFGKFGIKPKVNTCITGSLEGRLNNEEMNDMCKLVFNGVKAKKVEGIRDGNLISVSAYSPSMGHYIKVREKRVNLNLAIRYNSFEDKTYIWLATPVITVEY